MRIPAKNIENGPNEMQNSIQRDFSLTFATHSYDSGSRAHRLMVAV